MYMDSDAERTLNNLHVLGALSHNDKLMTNEDHFDIYAPTSLRGLLRMWYGERRGQNVQRVRNAVRAAIAFAHRSLEDATALLEAASTTSACSPSSVPSPAPPRHHIVHVSGAPPPSPSLSSCSSGTVSMLDAPSMRLRIDTISLQHVRMVEALGRARSGLANLLQTYRDDAALASQITLLTEEIEDFLRVMGPHTSSLRARARNDDRVSRPSASSSPFMTASGGGSEASGTETGRMSSLSLRD